MTSVVMLMLMTKMACCGQVSMCIMLRDGIPLSAPYYPWLVRTLLACANCLAEFLVHP
jgi:hypothetical protein